MNPYPKFLIALEKKLAERPPWYLAREDSERIQHWLANRRLNSVIGGLLTSIMGQVRAGSYHVRLAQVRDETEVERNLKELRANVDHRQAALATIELFVYNELKQRGLLHLIDGTPPS
jgi:hypothetical protein